MNINPHPNWMVKNLENSCDILDGQRIPLNEETRKTMKGSIPYYGANGVVDYINKYLFDEKLILVAEDGGNFSEYKTRPIAYMINGKSWVNNHAHVIRAREKGGFVTEYIFYNLEHKNVMQYIKGSTRTKLNQAELRKIPISIPPIVEQRGIAEVLSTVDEAIRRSDAVIEKAEKLKRDMMQRLLTRGIGHTEFKQTELGEIPIKWEIKEIGDLASIKRGSGYQYIFEASELDDKIPIIRINDFTTFEPKMYKKTQDVMRYIIKENDILFAGTGASAGITMIVNKNMEGFAHSYNALKITCNKINSYYLNYLLNSKIVKTQEEKRYTGAAQHFLDINSIAKMIIPLPPIEEQIQIFQIINEVDNMIINIVKKKEKKNILKTGLLQTLLSGQIRVRLDEGGLHRIGDS